MSRTALAGAAAWLSFALACGVKAPPRPPLPESSPAGAVDGGTADAGAGEADGGEAAWPDAGLPRITP